MRPLLSGTKFLMALLGGGAVPVTVPPLAAQTVAVDLGVQVGGTPGATTVSWQALPSASHYTVQRWRSDQSVCCRNASAPLTVNSWTDAPLLQAGAYVYRVTVHFADGRQGYNDKQYTRPEPVSPSGFTAVQQPNGSVLISWQPVPSAVYYVLEEPAAHTSAAQTAAGKLLRPVAPGVHTWLVSTCYSQPPQPICSDRLPSRVTLDVNRGNQ